MINPLKVFSAINLVWLIRHYIFAACIFSFFYFTIPSSNNTSFFIMIGINFLLFPFACFVWEELKKMLLGDNVFFINALFLIIAKIFIKFLLFMLALPIGIIGFLILWFIVNKQNN